MKFIHICLIILAVAAIGTIIYLKSNYDFYINSRKLYDTKKYKGVIVLDIDVTLTKSTNNIIKKLIKTAHNKKYDIYVNTMRHPSYCIQPITTDLDIPIYKHFCRITNDTLYSKKQNMDSIYNIVKCDKKNIILFDDLIDTIDHVKKNGYSAIHTPNGIKQRHIDMFLKMF